MALGPSRSDAVGALGEEPAPATDVILGMIGMTAVASRCCTWSNRWVLVRSTATVSRERSRRSTWSIRARCDGALLPRRIRSLRIEVLPGTGGGLVQLVQALVAQPP